jgi:hypothetical protein
MADRRIKGAVGLDGMVFRAGQEEAFDAALKGEKGKTLDLDQLEKDGHLVGYASKSARVDEAAVPPVVNRQREADGERADEDAVKDADAQMARETTAPAESVLSEAPAPAGEGEGEKTTTRRSRRNRNR